MVDDAEQTGTAGPPIPSFDSDAERTGTKSGPGYYPVMKEESDCKGPPIPTDDPHRPPHSVLLPTKVPMIEIDGEMLIVLEQPIFTKIKDANNPFTNLQDSKMKKHIDLINKQILKNGKSNLKPINGVFPIDHIIFFKIPVDEDDDDDCELE